MNFLDHVEDDDHLHVPKDDKKYFLLAVKKESDNKDEDYVNISFKKVNVKLKIDTGSQVNIIPRSILTQLPVKTPMTKTTARITSYTDNTMGDV